MNTSPKNIQLTPEQLQQLNVVQTRLANFEAEVTIATEALAQTRLEMAQAVKDKKYQEDELSKITADVSEATIQLQTMTVLINEKTDDLQIMQTTAATLSTKHEAKEQELTEREKELNKKEKDFIKKQGILTEGITKLDEDKKSVEEKKQKIQSIISSI